MRIARLRTTVVAVPQKRAYKSTWRRKGHGATALQAVLVELETDDGLVGIGEAPVVWAGDAEVTRALTEAVAPLVVGADALEPDVVRRRLYAETGMAHLGTQGISWALSGIDTALWDLLGRAAGQPLHRLWGGAWRTRSPFHADLVPDEPERMADDAREWVERGFRTLYLKVGFDPAVDEARVRAVREAVGDGPRIRIDANAAWSPALAVTLLTRLAQYGLEYAEQPIPAGDAAAAGRRADGQPRPRDLDRDHAAALPHQPHRNHGAGRHARQRDGRSHAPARDRARSRPDRARRAGRALRRALGAGRGRRARRLRRRVQRLMKIGFFLREAMRSIGRNAVPSFAALASVLVTLLVLGVFIPIVQATTGAANDVRGRVLVNVYMQPDAAKADVERVEALLNRTDGVKRVEFISSQQAYQEERRKNPEAYELLGSNPLPDTFRLTPDDPDEVLKLVSALAPQTPGGGRTTADPAIEVVKSSKDDTQKILVATRVVKLTTGLLAVLLVIASVLLISNTVRLSVFSRRREIQVMKLVGATDGFIRWPFVIEGIILGALGALLAVLLLGVMKVALVDPLVDDFALLAAPDTIGFGVLIAVLMITGILVSALGSAISLRRFLQV